MVDGADWDVLLQGRYKVDIGTGYAHIDNRV